MVHLVSCINCKLAIEDSFDFNAAWESETSKQKKKKDGAARNEGNENLYILHERVKEE